MLSVVITAGGSGLRMGGEIPKQFLPLNGKPILMHTMEFFHRFEPMAQLIIALPENQLALWNELCEKHAFTIQHEIVFGGEERFHSVRNALEKATGNWIAVHDGVRPLISKRVMENLLVAVKEKKAVIPVVPLKDSLRLIDDETHSVNVPRANYRAVQTPQLFDASLLKKAYEQEYAAHFTDDASVIEAIGVRIHLISGNEENIKITTPVDLKLAEVLWGML